MNHATAQPHTAPYRTKVKIGPLRHLVRGVRLLTTHNLVTTLLLCLISVVSMIVLNFVAVFSLVYILLNASADLSATLVMRFIMFGLVMVAAVVIVSSFFQLALTRALISSIKMRSLTVGDAFIFARQRFGLAIRTNVRIFGLLIGIYLGILLLTAILSSANSDLGMMISVVLFLVMIPVALIIVLRLLFVQFVLADDQQPPDAKSVLKRARLLWQRSTGAVLLYILLCFVLSIIFLIVFIVLFGEDALDTTETNEFGVDTSTSFNLLNIIITNTISTFIGLLFNSGFAHIYEEATSILRNHHAATQMSHNQPPTQPPESQLRAAAPTLPPAQPPIIQANHHGHHGQHPPSPPPTNP